MKILKLFIDENILKVDKLKELDQLANQVHYFYIKIDPCDIKNKPKNRRIIKNLKAEKEGYKYYVSNGYLRDVNDIKKSKKFSKRFHIIERIEKETSYNENFSNGENLHKNCNFPIRIKQSEESIIKYNDISDKLKRINLNWNNNYKDLSVIAHFIFVDDRYGQIKTLDSNAKFRYYFDGTRPSVINKNSYKYLISSDRKGFFSPCNIKKIEKQFGNKKIKILHYTDKIKDISSEIKLFGN